MLRLRFPQQDQERVNELASKAREGSLNAEERDELDGYNLAGDVLAVWQSKARRSLSRQQSGIRTIRHGSRSGTVRLASSTWNLRILPSSPGGASFRGHWVGSEAPNTPLMAHGWQSGPTDAPPATADGERRRKRFFGGRALASQSPFCRHRVGSEAANALLIAHCRTLAAGARFNDLWLRPNSLSAAGTGGRGW